MEAWELGAMELSVCVCLHVWSHGVAMASIAVAFLLTIFSAAETLCTYVCAYACVLVHTMYFELYSSVKIKLYTFRQESREG